MKKLCSWSTGTYMPTGWLLAVAIGLLVICGAAMAAVGPESDLNNVYWDDQFPILGTNGNVFATAKDTSGNLYIGGDFTIVGNVAANYVAKWTATTSSWSTLGTGMNNSINILAVDGSGNVYAGGDFTTAGGVSASRVAKWNGSAWSALGMGVGGITSYVSALAIDGFGNVYIGGDFSTVGGVAANYVAKWNGTAWSPLGTGMNNTVRTIAVDGSGNVYAGGDFTTAGGVTANYVAKWNGTAWSPLGTGMNNTVSTIAVDGSGTIYAGGAFSTANGNPASRIAKWNGTAWAALGSGMNQIVLALSSDSLGNVYAGGNFTTAGGSSANRVAKWNGAAWSALGTGMNAWVRALAADSSGNVYAGGDFSSADGFPANCVAKWKGAAWSALGRGMNGSVLTLAADGFGNVYAGGNFTTAGDLVANRVVKWDGTAWSALGTGMNNSVHTVAVDGLGNIYAGGNFTTAGGVTVNRVAKWNGTAWSALGTGMNNGVYALTVDGAGNVYAGGIFTTAGGVTVNRVAKWNGTAWSALGGGMNGPVDDLVVDNSGNVYAGGQFTMAGGGVANFVARWNGTTWSALGTGTNTPVIGIALDVSGNVYVGGNFTSAGGVTANYVAKWDGMAWSALGTGMNNIVNAVAVDGLGNIYAGGNFTTAGGVTVNCIAKWDGMAWSSLGTGMDSTVTALVAERNVLHAGGSFSFAGGKVSRYFATWQPRANQNQFSFSSSPGALTLGNDAYGFYKPAITTDTSTTVSYAGGLPVNMTLSRADEIHAGGIRVNGALTLSPDGVGFGGSGATLRVEFSEDDMAAYGFAYTEFRAAKLSYPADYPINMETTSCMWLGEAIPAPVRIENGKQIYAIAVPITAIGSAYGAVPRSLLSYPPPTASFTVSPNPAAPGQSITFDASASTVSPGYNIVSYAWNFGDVTPGSGQIVTHAYGLFNAYTATLTVTDNQVPPKTDTTTVLVTVNQGNRAPVSVPGGPYVIAQGQNLSLDGSGSSDPDAGYGDSIVSYQWDVNGDGNFTDATGVSPTLGWMQLLTLGIVAPYSGTLSLRVADTFGATGTASTTLQVVVAPNAPVSPGSTNITTSQIRWTWMDNSTNESGFKVWADPGSGPPLTWRTTTAANVQFWDYPSLAPNTRHAFQVAATNIAGDSAKTPNYSAWTLIEPVSGLAFSGVTTTAISVEATNTPSNLSSGTSGLHYANTTAGTNSGWVQNMTPWASGSLSPNTQYAFSGKSRNGNSVETTPVTAGKYTLIEAVSNLTFSGVTDTSISVAPVGPLSNLSAGSSGVRIENQSGGNSGWQQSLAAWPSSGLTPNTLYTFRGTSRNSEAVETTPITRTKYTLARSPVAPIVQNPGVHSLDVRIGSGDSNPPNTDYAIQISPSVGGNTWVRVDGTVGPSAMYQTAAAWGTKTVTGLAEYTNYAFRVTARNGEGIATTQGPAASARTLDGTPPTAVLSSTAPALVNSAITVNVTLSENSTTFESGDITVIDALVSNFTGSGDSYSFTLTPTLTMPGTFSCVVLAGAFSDLSSNPSVADSNILSRNYDRWPPTVLLSCTAPAYVQAPVQVTAMLSEASVTFEAGDVDTTNASVNAFTPQPDGVTFTFQLAPGNQGLFSCRVQAGVFTDFAGNANTEASEVIERIYDTLPPTGTIAINGGAAYTNALAVTLSLTADDGTGSGVTHMQFSNDNVSWSGWEPYATIKAWTLLSGEGPKTVYVAVRDAAGNVSSPASAPAITYDGTPPSCAFLINGGNASTNFREVTLTFNADDGSGSGLLDVRLSNDAVTWSPWDAYAPEKTWTLTEGFGPKTVYATFRDKAGNVSAECSDAVTLVTVGTISEPALAMEGDEVSISIVTVDILREPPTVTVNGHPADYDGGKAENEYAFHYTVLDSTQDPVGPAEIVCICVDLEGHVGVFSNSGALTITATSTVPVGALPMLAGLSFACAFAGARILRRKR